MSVLVQCHVDHGRVALTTVPALQLEPANPLERSIPLEPNPAFQRNTPFESSNPLEGDAAMECDAPLEGVHCRNASTLARVHPLPADPFLVFEEAGHTYTAWGQRVERSTTRLLHDECFDEFDGAACTDTFYAGWKTNPKNKYYARVHELLQAGLDDEAVKAQIRADWSALGEEAAKLGTALHAHCEYDMNGEPTPPLDPEIVPEVAQYEAFKASAFVHERGLVPFRSELTVAYRGGDGLVACAGQIDALYRDAEGHVYLFDFKRVEPKHKLTPKARGFMGHRGKGVAAHLPDAHFWKYSLQTSAYNVMLRATHGLDAGDRMYLLRMHKKLPTYELVQCADLRAEATAMLENELARLRSVRASI